MPILDLFGDEPFLLNGTPIDQTGGSTGLQTQLTNPGITTGFTTPADNPQKKGFERLTDLFDLFGEEDQDGSRRRKQVDTLNIFRSNLFGA